MASFPVVSARIAVVLLTTCPFLVACGGSASSPDAKLIDAPVVDARVVDAGITTVTKSGKISDLATGMGIANAQVCVSGLPTSPCATTDSSGIYSIALPFPDGTTDIAVVITAAGLLGEERLLEERASAPVWIDNPFALLSPTLAEQYLHQEAQFTYPSSTTGFADVFVFGPTPDDRVTATATITPASGLGPVYVANSGTPTPSLTATDNGEVLFGNLAPGRYGVTVHATGLTCSVAATAGGNVDNEWTPTDGATIDLAVTANALTEHLGVSCH